MAAWLLRRGRRGDGRHLGACPWERAGRPDAGESSLLTVATPVDNPYCSCKLTRAGPAQTLRFGGPRRIDRVVVREDQTDGAAVRSWEVQAQLVQAQLPAGSPPGAGPPQHGLSSNKMALITSDFRAMCHPDIKWANHLGLRAVQVRGRGSPTERRWATSEHLQLQCVSVSLSLLPDDAAVSYRLSSDV